VDTPTSRRTHRIYETPMPDLLLALFAGTLTIAAPCTLPVLAILLGASIGRRTDTRPVFIAAGFVVSFAFVALLLNAIATALHFDPDALRTIGLALLLVFGALMIWPAIFERLASHAAISGILLRPGAAAQTNLGGFVLGTTLGLVWTPCAGPVLGAILTAITTSTDHVHGAASAAHIHPRRSASDAGNSLRRTGGFDPPAPRGALRRAIATGVRRHRHRVRCERISAI
jgi:cytochrome c biogenesis protein CcdA